MTSFLRAVGVVDLFLTVRIVLPLECDEIVGEDGQIYRVRLGDVVTLPRLNAEVLIERGAAELVEELDEVDLFLEEAML